MLVSERSRSLVEILCALLSADHGASFSDVERATYEKALARAGGNVSAAARALRISRAQLDYRLRRLGLNR